jgi:hypothetical protein
MVSVIELPFVSVAGDPRWFAAPCGGLLGRDHEPGRPKNAEVLRYTA